MKALNGEYETKRSRDPMLVYTLRCTDSHISAILLVLPWYYYMHVHSNKIFNLWGCNMKGVFWGVKFSRMLKICSKNSGSCKKEIKTCSNTNSREWIFYGSFLSKPGKPQLFKPSKKQYPNILCTYVTIPIGGLS